MKFEDCKTDNDGFRYVEEVLVPMFKKLDIRVIGFSIGATITIQPISDIIGASRIPWWLAQRLAEGAPPKPKRELINHYSDMWPELDAWLEEYQVDLEGFDDGPGYGTNIRASTGLYQAWETDGILDACRDLAKQMGVPFPEIDDNAAFKHRRKSNEQPQ